jgi:hypothetical protein
MANVSLSANVSPIYPREIIRWRSKLLAQVVPRTITTETPILLGVAGDNGSIIHNITVLHLGDNVATVVRLWSSQSDETDYFLENELSLVDTTSTTNTAAIAPVAFVLPAILPNGNTGMHLAPGESLYGALGVAIASGVIIIVRGGDY